MANVYDVANFFIDIANKSADDTITNLKLNKLLYFAQGVFWARIGKVLFKDKISAWVFGPVVPSIYRKYSPCGKHPIEYVDTSFNSDSFTAEELDVLFDVMREIGQYTGSKLVSNTHQQGTPWSEVYEQGKKHVIETSSMKEYFTKHPIKSFSMPNTAEVVRVLPKDWYDPSEDDEWKAYLK